MQQVDSTEKIVEWMNLSVVLREARDVLALIIEKAKALKPTPQKKDSREFNVNLDERDRAKNLLKYRMLKDPYLGIKTLKRLCNSAELLKRKLPSDSAR